LRREGKEAMPPNLLAGPNKFQERPPGACRMEGNLLATAAPPQTTLGNLQHFPDP